jgi:integrase
MKNTKVSNSTINVRLNALNRYYKFLERKKYYSDFVHRDLFKNPIDFKFNIKINDTEAKPIAVHELDSLVEYLQGHVDETSHIIAMLFIAGFGIKASQLYRIRKSHIKFQNDNKRNEHLILSFQPGGQNVNLIQFILPSFNNHIKSYLSEKRLEEFLFTTSIERAVQYELKRFSKFYGEPIKTINLRQLFASLLFCAIKSKHYVSDKLMFKNPKTINRYIDPNPLHFATANTDLVFILRGFNELPI